MTDYSNNRHGAPLRGWRYGSWPPCPKCGTVPRAISRRPPGGGGRRDLVECFECGAIYPRPVCPDCGHLRFVSTGCRSCSSRKHPVNAEAVA